MTDLGKIVLTDGGTWNSETEYEILTMVRYNKASYYSIQSSVGQEPSETSAYWRLVAKDGNEVTVDSDLSSTSKNPVQNKVINTALAGKASSTHTHSAATTSANGFMSSADKTKLNGIASGANKTTVDSALSSSSTNPVQNKVVDAAIKSLGAAVIISATAPSQTANVLWVKPGGSA